ncbi:MAG: hypothetical protein AAF725_07740 [Acidobacteriota bacterium]
MIGRDPHGTADSYRVKGSSIRSKLVYLSETFGADAERQMREFLEDLGAWPILEASWYRYEIYDGTLVWIARRFLGGEISRLREVGKFSAEKALTTTYEAFRSSGDFARFLEKMPVLHSRYYSHGTLSASLVLPGASRCQILLDGAPKHSEADLTVASGFYIRCAELMGHRQVVCGFRHEGQRVRFELAWEG